MSQLVGRLQKLYDKRNRCGAAVRNPRPYCGFIHLPRPLPTRCLSDFELEALRLRHDMSRIPVECHGNLSVKNGRRQMFLCTFFPVQKSWGYGTSLYKNGYESGLLSITDPLNSKIENKRKKTASPKANGFSYILNQVEPD
ncbi:hypothetical protein ACX12E_29245 [Paenibacillus vandeheii]